MLRRVLTLALLILLAASLPVFGESADTDVDPVVNEGQDELLDDVGFVDGAVVSLSWSVLDASDYMGCKTTDTEYATVQAANCIAGHVSRINPDANALPGRDFVPYLVKPTIACTYKAWARFIGREDAIDEKHRNYVNRHCVILGKGFILKPVRSLVAINGMLPVRSPAFAGVRFVRETSLLLTGSPASD